MQQEPQLNAHNKQEWPPMHTAEHILNGTMVKMFGCPRSRNAHIERKKSKADYELAQAPTEEQVRARMSAQMDDEEKRSKADYGLWNDGVISLGVQLDALVNSLKKGK